jgi:hypothetical protein
MTYNEKYHSENQKLSQPKLQTLIQSQEITLDYLKNCLLATNGLVQLAECHCFINILSKVRINLEAVNSLIPFLFDDFRFKSSVNLVYRGIIDDLINIDYLLCFINFADPEQKALASELMIMHKDFIRSSKEMFEGELDFNNLKNRLHGLPENNIDRELEQLRLSNAELLDETDDTKYKKNIDLRQSGHPHFRQMLKEAGDTSAHGTSESTKLKVVDSRGYEEASQLKFIFKYLTQFQHYSPKSIELIHNDIVMDIQAYQHTLGTILIVTNRLFNVLKFRDFENLKNEWENVADYVFNTFN